MLLASYIIGTHLWFFREGSAFTVPAPGVCGQEAKPGIGDGAAFDPAWVDLGAVETFDPAVGQEEHKLWRPSPGKLVLKDVLENKQEFSAKFTTNDVGPLAMEMFFRSSAVLEGAQKQFVPLSSVSKRGWLHGQFYDQDNANWLNLDMWVRLRCAMKFDGSPTKPEFELFMLYSSLNTGAIV